MFAIPPRPTRKQKLVFTEQKNAAPPCRPTPSPNVPREALPLRWWHSWRPLAGLVALVALVALAAQGALER
jgi:hypothetical protein